MPLRAAVAPASGAPDVVEVVEDVSGPGPRNSRDQRTTRKIVGKSVSVTNMLEIGQVTGGHQIPRLPHVTVVGEGLALSVVENGHIRLGLAGEVAVVVRPLKPLDGIPVPTAAALGEDRRKCIGREATRGRHGGRALNASQARCSTGENRSAGNEFAQARQDSTATQQRKDSTS